MREIAPDVHLITGFPPLAVNCYLVGDVLIDAMGKRDAKHILKELKGRTVNAHALTHAHPDHQGASHAVCEALSIPLWAHGADAEVVEDPALMLARQPKAAINKVMFKMFAGPAHPVARHLVEGDEVAGFEILHTPGHAAGHVVFWRASDRVLIAGDVVNTQNPLLTFPRGPRQPFDFFTPDPEENRRSARKLAPLRPELVLFGHGPPLRDPQRFVSFVESLPE